MSAWTCRHTDGKVVQKIVPPRPRIPWWKGPGADSEEKQEPASDIDTALMDSLKVLDPEGPIREADIVLGPGYDLVTSQRHSWSGKPAKDHEFLRPTKVSGIRRVEGIHRAPVYGRLG